MGAVDVLGQAFVVVGPGSGHDAYVLVRGPAERGVTHRRGARERRARRNGRDPTGDGKRGAGRPASGVTSGKLELWISTGSKPYVYRMAIDSTVQDQQIKATLNWRHFNIRPALAWTKPKEN